MKKIMFAAAVAAAGLAFGVESANTVGYVSKAGVLGNVWTIVPCQFEATGTVDIDLNAYVKGDFVKTVSFYDEGWENLAPQIQIRDPQTGNTTFYYYLKDAYVEGGNPSEVEGWANYNGDYVDAITVEPGSAFWFRNSADCTLSLAGQVVGEDTSSLTVYPIWTLIGNAFPQATALNKDINWTGIDNTVSFYDEGWENLAPQIQQRAADGTTSFFYYLKDAYVEGGDPSELEGWANYNGDYVPVTTTLEPGVGFWFRPTAQLTIQSVK